jgi:hypothetical protein
MAKFNSIGATTVDQIPISRFSIITRISPKALRYYDRVGLLGFGLRRAGLIPGQPDPHDAGRLGACLLSGLQE